MNINLALSLPTESALAVEVPACSEKMKMPVVCVTAKFLLKT